MTKHEPETDPEELIDAHVRLPRWQIEALRGQATETGATWPAYLRALLARVLRKESKIQ